MAYKHSFTVKVRDSFPMDMLAHDGCFPSTSRDANNIVSTYLPFLPPLSKDNPWRVEISLSVLSEDWAWQPSIGHWNKRGCSIGTIWRER
jgi:hypothetical protein